MPNKYIKKSDVEKLLYECTPKWENYAQVFSFLKWMETISTLNPEGVLEEMIKAYDNIMYLAVVRDDVEKEKEIHRAEKTKLIEALSRIRNQ